MINIKIITDITFLIGIIFFGIGGSGLLLPHPSKTIFKISKAFINTSLILLSVAISVYVSIHK